MPIRTRRPDAMDFDYGQPHGGADGWSHVGVNGFDAPSSFGPGSKMTPQQEYGMAGGQQASALSQGLQAYSIVGPTYVIIIFVPAFDSPTATVSHSAPSGSPNLQSAHFADQKSNGSMVFAPPVASEAARVAPPPVADAAGQAVLQTPQAPAQATPTIAVSRSPVSVATNSNAFSTGAATDARSRLDVVSIGQLSAQAVVHEAQAVSAAVQSNALEGGAARVLDRTSIESLFAQASSPAMALSLLHSKAVLAAVPLNLKGVEQALEHVMSDVQRLGSQVSEWLDENRAAAIVLGVTTVIVGGAAAYYLRRRTLQDVEDRDDDTSSHWLFVRMQTPPGD